MTTTTTSTAPPTSTTATAAPPRPALGAEQAVGDAYLRSWEVYADAMLRLDPTGLPEVYSGDALELRREEVAGLAGKGTPARMEVEHDFQVVVLNADEALVLETYRNHSVLLDGETMEPIEPDPDNVLKREYVLRREPTGWRVTQVTGS